MKTGSFPHDDTHLVTLVLSSGQRRSITVIPPDTPQHEAGELLALIADSESGRPEWENDGGQSQDV